jgi:DNA-binding transcriptional ArsR family regulator
MSREVGKADPSSLAEIDRLVHEPARLAVMSLLYVLDSADFIFLMNQTDLTWGNLSAHISKLEDAGYVKVEKTFKGKRPNTTLKLTSRGRDAFRAYATKMKQAFQDFNG